VTDARTSWLTSFDPGGVWPPTRVTLLRQVRVGERHDWMWADVSRPIPLSGQRGGSPQPTMRILLGARHTGGDIRQPIVSPLHVYICLPNAAGDERDEYTANDLAVARWGILYPNEESALSGVIA
jgi:hypothetical protein